MWGSCVRGGFGSWFREMVGFEEGIGNVFRGWSGWGVW